MNTDEHRPDRARDVGRRDVLIVGLGLAGAALAWTLLRRGASVFVVDREEQGTSSRIAAGLMTCVTGQRLVKSWRWDELWPFAVEFYRGIEAETGTSLLDVGPMVRFLNTDAERKIFEKKRKGELAGLVCAAPNLEADGRFQPSAAEGAIEILPGGRLRVADYLNVTREMLQRTDSYRCADLRLPGDVELAADGIRIPSLDLVVDRVVLCLGFAARGCPWLDWLRWNPARGEILTVDIPDLGEDRVVHAGVWIARQQGTRYRVGATYDWKSFDSGPTEAGRAELVGRLERALRVPFEVLGHDSAVRPILHDLTPLIGPVPGVPNVAVFNGLGSKGTLQAPFFADELVHCIGFA